jgi:multidrug efflux pump subunit AcrA (membrane-fusion protein)
MRLVPVEPGVGMPAAAAGQGEGVPAHEAHGRGSDSARVELVAGRMKIHVSPRKQQLIGVQTESLHVRELHSTVRAVGRVDYDESAVADVNAKISGWIERLHVATTGQRVRQGQPLLEIYSPELVSAQEEYLIALRARDELAKASDRDAASNAAALAVAARRRLQLWDITEAQIDALERSGVVRKTLDLVAPSSGYVVEKSALLGKRVQTGENLFRIADMRRVWILTDVYESDLAFVRVGLPARIELAYLPGQTITGQVSYVYPYLQESTRTVQLRIVADNPDLELKPGMYANVVLQSSAGARARGSEGGDLGQR